MEALGNRRCLHHFAREAVARCPECSQYFCRECIVEHDDRVICAGCLKQLVRAAAPARERAAFLLRVLGCLFGVFVAWLFFYETGRVLLLIPTSFHDGTLWHHSDS